MNESPILTRKSEISPTWQTILGSTLLITGLLIFADPYIWPGKLRPLSPLVAGLWLAFWSVRTRRSGYVVGSGLLGGFGVATAYVSMSSLPLTLRQQIGIIWGGLALGCLAIVVFTRLLGLKPAFWALIPATLSLSLSYVLLLTAGRLMDYSLIVLVATGVILISLGIVRHRIAFLIPGCLLLGIGPGIYAAWGRLGQPNALTPTGLMLLWFALGWFLITIFSRAGWHRSLWWPLIPGGVLAVAGLALYIAGNPSGAGAILSNTGSIVMIIFGLYLLLMRYGVQR